MEPLDYTLLERRGTQDVVTLCRVVVEAHGTRLNIRTSMVPHSV